MLDIGEGMEEQSMKTRVFSEHRLSHGIFQQYSCYVRYIHYTLGAMIKAMISFIPSFMNSVTDLKLYL